MFNLLSAETDTPDRILEATLEAIGRHGPHKLSMRDVAAAAGVSRGTVYRYFATKDELLQALVRYEQRRFEVGLAAALQATPPGPARINAVLRYAEGYLWAHPALHRVRDSEPGFVLAYLGRQLPHLREALTRSLGPALSASEAVVRGSTTVEELSDVLLRILVSSFLVPADDHGPSIEAIAKLVAPRPSRSRRHVKEVAGG